jgi:ferritin-like metal-binding protein YciE
MNKNSQETIVRYIKDLIAAEKSFETQLTAFAKEANDPTIKHLFENHATETKGQYEKLIHRLNELGDDTGLETIFKSVMAHLAGLAPKFAQVGQYDEEITTQNLIMAYAIEQGEVAAYEALALAASVAGDHQTEVLARAIQEQEIDTAEKVWECLLTNAQQSFKKVVNQ